MKQLKKSGRLTRQREAAGSVPVLGRWLADDYYRVRLGLWLSLLLNLCFAGLKLLGAFRWRSRWEGGLAAYYILLCVLRLYLLRRIPSSPGAAGEQLEWRQARVAGRLLFLLNVTLAGLAAMIVIDGQSYSYPGFGIYAMAFYSFYCLGISVSGVMKYRKYRSPLLSAAKTVNITCALVTLFTLQTAMIARFGGEAAELFRFAMTAATGSVVYTCVLGMALFTTLQADRHIRRFEDR